MENNKSLEERVKDCKANLPKQIVPLFVFMFPEHDTSSEGKKVTRVVQLRTFDLEIIEKLEKLVNHLKQFKK